MLALPPQPNLPRAHPQRIPIPAILKTVAAKLVALVCGVFLMLGTASMLVASMVPQAQLALALGMLLAIVVLMKLAHA